MSSSAKWEIPSASQDARQGPHVSRLPFYPQDLAQGSTEKALSKYLGMKECTEGWLKEKQAITIKCCASGRKYHLGSEAPPYTFTQVRRTQVG